VPELREEHAFRRKGSRLRLQEVREESSGQKRQVSHVLSIDLAWLVRTSSRLETSPSQAYTANVEG